MALRLLRSWGLVGAPERAAEDLSVEELIAEGRVPHKVVELLGSEGERARVAQEAMLRAIAESEDERRSLSERAEKARGLSVEELVDGGHVPDKVVEYLESETERARQAQEAMLRAIAESEDVRRRLTTQQEQAVRLASEDLLKAMLPVLDNLELGLHHSDAEDVAPLREAIEMTLRQWYGVFERVGATRIETERGGEFDPGVHEGVMQDSEADLPAGTISRVLQSGFSFHGRLLRPTRVAVSTGEGLSALEDEKEAPPEPAETKAGPEPAVSEAHAPTKKAKAAPRRRRRAAATNTPRKKQPKRPASRKKR